MNINELIERLKRAEKRYEEKDFLWYCIDCDNIAKDSCYKSNHTLLYKEENECDEIEDWIECLEYVRKNLIEFIRFSKNLEKN